MRGGWILCPKLQQSVSPLVQVWKQRKLSLCPRHSHLIHICKFFRRFLTHCKCSTYIVCLVAKLCPTFCDHMDCSLPGCSIHGISQERILEGLPFLSPRDLPDSGIEPMSSALAGRFFTTEPKREVVYIFYFFKFFYFLFLLYNMVYIF